MVITRWMERGSPCAAVLLQLCPITAIGEEQDGKGPAVTSPWEVAAVALIVSRDLSAASQEHGIKCSSERDN